MDMMRRRKEKKARDREVPALPASKPHETVEERVSAIYDRFVTRTQADVTGLWEMLGSRRKLMWINFLAGISRGVGFFLGVTLIGGLIIGGTAFVLDNAAEAMGWKEITFASMVESVYGKFREVQAVITDIKGEPGDRTASARPEAGFGYAAPAYYDRAAPLGYTTADPPGGPPPEASGR